MDKKLLSILCCPVTHAALFPAQKDLVDQLNDAIDRGELSNRDGVVLTDHIAEALTTKDRKIVYPVADGIPVLLEGESLCPDDLASRTR